MYSSLFNQIYNIVHYLVGFYILFILYPKIIFTSTNELLLDNCIRNYLKTVFIFIIIGYILVITKLYEFIGLIIVMFGIYAFTYSCKTNKSEFNEKITRINVYIYDSLDNKVDYKKDIKNFLKGKIISFKKNILKDFKIKTIIILLFNILIFSYTTILRFYNSIKHAAPSMSDSSVTLAWMKYINNRILFHDGIYPQGFHIYLATLHKFVYTDYLYILNYTGPLNGVFITLGIYFIVSRLTGKAYSGMIAAIIYGILICFLSSDWVRQAATNSQEFGFVFIMPTLYFYYKYLKSEKKEDLITGFCGLSSIGLIHTVAFTFVVVGVAAVTITFLLIDLKRSLKKIWKIFLSGVLSVIIAIIPVLIGKLMGQSFNSSSEEFLVSKANNIAFPQMRIMDYAAFVAVFFIFICIIYNFKRLKEQSFNLFIIIFAAFSFCIYYYGGPITKSTVVVTRFSELWNLTIPLVIGTGFCDALNIFKNKTLNFAMGICCVAALMLMCIFYFKPQVIVPYKVQYDAAIDEYLQITKYYRPTEWHLVSAMEGGYALVYGAGYHIEAGDFLKEFKPEDKFIRDINTKVKLPDVFIFHEKVPFKDGKLSGQAEINYNTKKDLEEKMTIWINKYKKTHSNITVFYEDKNFEILHIHQDAGVKTFQMKVWGN